MRANRPRRDGSTLGGRASRLLSHLRGLNMKSAERSHLSLRGLDINFAERSHCPCGAGCGDWTTATATDGPRGGTRRGPPGDRGGGRGPCGFHARDGPHTAGFGQGPSRREDRWRVAAAPGPPRSGGPSVSCSAWRLWASCLSCSNFSAQIAARTACSCPARRYPRKQRRIICRACRARNGVKTSPLKRPSTASFLGRKSSQRTSKRVQSGKRVLVFHRARPWSWPMASVRSVSFLAAFSAACRRPPRPARVGMSVRFGPLIHAPRSWIFS